jgi:carbonic anhydrase
MGHDDLGPINPWLRHIRDVYRLHKAELDGIADEEARYKRLVELNVLEQCTNAMKLPEVKEGFENGSLSVNGWVFDISTGKLIDLGFDFKAVHAEMGMY